MWAYNGHMEGDIKISRREAAGLAAALGVGTGELLAQAAGAQAGASRTPAVELEIARQQRLRDAQRIAAVKLPQAVEPAFRFRP